MWVEIRNKAIKMLDSLQGTFGKVLLSLPVSAQDASLRAALGLLGMKWRVWEAKINLIQAIRRQEDGGLPKENLNEQINMSWLGLEVSIMCKEIHLPDASTKEVDKEVIRKAIKYDHLKSLKLDLRGEKLKEMANSDVSTRQAYTGWILLECRMAYSLETRMFVCRANMPTLYKRDLTFRAYTPGADQRVAGPVEDQDHLEVCPGLVVL